MFSLVGAIFNKLIDFSRISVSSVFIRSGGTGPASFNLDSVKKKIEKMRSLGDKTSPSMRYHNW